MRITEKMLSSKIEAINERLNTNIKLEYNNVYRTYSLYELGQNGAYNNTFITSSCEGFKAKELFMLLRGVLATLDRAPIEYSNIVQ